MKTQGPISPLKRWLLAGYIAAPEGPYEQEHEVGHHEHPWWKVMCLTGVDYFSTLGYQPGIAFLAAGALSPLATLILVLLTLFGAFPIYRRVAIESPHGEGSISMLEHLLAWWQGKLFVLALLGFVATDFVITITLSAADATAHLVENPFLEKFVHGMEVPITLVLVGLLGGVFLKGFKEAIGIAVVLVSVYLTLNCIVVAKGIAAVLSSPVDFHNWQTALSKDHGGNPAALLLVAVLVFPRLALGLSGFETGVAVMPLVKGRSDDNPARPKARIKNTRKLLLVAALIMSVFLIASSLVTTLHIPAAEFLKGGKANGRALAYLAHELLGDKFGTVYDISTILILWFAGASAMAGLLNIVPRYLPRYGMAPEWTRAVRPLVLIFTLLAFFITIVFKADVDAQGGAYATGVLVLMTSAAVAVTISAWKRQVPWKATLYGLVTAVFAYTTVANVIERPDGIKIASFFILTIVLVSLVSRVWRTLELRVDQVKFDSTALNFINEAVQVGGPTIRLLANRPEARDVEEYTRQLHDAQEEHNLPGNAPFIFLEVDINDASNFTGSLRVVGVQVGEHRVLRAEGTAVPNGIAALLLYIRDLTGAKPHAYLSWGEGNPGLFLIKFILSGQGDIARLTREILRRAEPDAAKRPAVHVS